MDLCRATVTNYSDTVHWVWQHRPSPPHHQSSRPWISANPQSQTRLRFSMTSLLFVSRGVFSFFIAYEISKISNAQQCPQHILSGSECRRWNRAVKMNVIVQSPVVFDTSTESNVGSLSYEHVKQVPLSLQPSLCVAEYHWVAFREQGATSCCSVLLWTWWKERKTCFVLWNWNQGHGCSDRTNGSWCRTSR